MPRMWEQEDVRGATRTNLLNAKATRGEDGLWHCLRCDSGGKGWLGRVGDEPPRQCRFCHSSYWMVARTNKRASAPVGPPKRRAGRGRTRTATLSSPSGSAPRMTRTPTRAELMLPAPIRHEVD
jgi:hypothetical protein